MKEKQVKMTEGSSLNNQVVSDAINQWMEHKGEADLKVKELTEARFKGL